MQNTWSIDRTWTPRKGRSRPALMVEDNTTPAPMRGGGISLTAHPACGNMHEHSQAIEEHETRVRHPVPKPPGDPDPPREGSEELKIRGGHGLGETPGPIPNPEAKTQHGNGTAPGRVWESSTPPPLHVNMGDILGRTFLRMPPFFHIRLRPMLGCSCLPAQSREGNNQTQLG